MICTWLFADQPNKCSGNAVGHSNMCIKERSCFGRSLMHISAILHSSSKWYSASSSLKLLYHRCLADFVTSSSCRVARGTSRRSLKLCLEHRRRIDNGILRAFRAPTLLWSEDLYPHTITRNVPTPSFPFFKEKKKQLKQSQSKNAPPTWCLRVLANAI